MLVITVFGVEVIPPHKSRNWVMAK